MKTGTREQYRLRVQHLQQWINYQRGKWDKKLYWIKDRRQDMEVKQFQLNYFFPAHYILFKKGKQNNQNLIKHNSSKYQ